MGCNYLSMPFIHALGTTFQTYCFIPLTEVRNTEHRQHGRPVMRAGRVNRLSRSRRRWLHISVWWQMPCEHWSMTPAGDAQQSHDTHGGHKDTVIVHLGNTLHSFYTRNRTRFIILVNGKHWLNQTVTEINTFWLGCARASVLSGCFFVLILT